MHATAQRINADFIITRNVKDYKKSIVPVLTTDDFILKLST